jgi:hypothetical protein
MNTLDKFCYITLYLVGIPVIIYGAVAGDDLAAIFGLCCMIYAEVSK